MTYLEGYASEADARAAVARYVSGGSSAILVGPTSRIAAYVNRGQIDWPNAGSDSWFLVMATRDPIRGE